LSEASSRASSCAPFLGARFDGGERYVKRLRKVAELERDGRFAKVHDVSVPIRPGIMPSNAHDKQQSSSQRVLRRRPAPSHRSGGAVDHRAATSDRQPTPG
jgi:hypothetical protein